MTVFWNVRRFAATAGLLAMAVVCMQVAPAAAAGRQAPRSNGAVFGPVLGAGQRLSPGRYLVSPNGQYTFIMQTDGNLVLYQGTTALWNSGTQGHAGATAIMQTDGNLVVYP